MTPFCCSGRGGFHVKYRVREVVASTEKFRGGPDGTETNQVRKTVNNMPAKYKSKAVPSIGAGGETVPQRTSLINSALTDHLPCYCSLVSQARPTNPSTGCFKYACPMHNTKSNPHCSSLSLSLLGCSLPSAD